MARLARDGVRQRRVWLRYPFLLSVPLLAYARWRGHSWHEEIGDVRYGYWAFDRSRLIKTVLPWTMLADATIAACRRIYWPLWRGYTIVCERFVLDMLVDLAVGLGDAAFHTRLPGRLYPHLIPREGVVICLDLDVAAICARRPELAQDRCLAARLALYRRLAADRGLVSLSSALPVQRVSQQIADTVAAQPADGPHGYARLQSPFLRLLARSPLLALAAHWALQGLLYMDRTERWAKLGLDLGLALFTRLLLGRSLPALVAWSAAVVIAHTANLLLNGHLWGVLKHCGLVHHSRRDFGRYVEGFLGRALNEPAIESVWICGGLSREAWSPASDLDARLLRRPGAIYGARACWHLLRERSRALWARFPLDAYVVDSGAGLLRRGISLTDEPLDRSSWREMWGVVTETGIHACPASRAERA
jgi:hypothetical protein